MLLISICLTSCCLTVPRPEVKEGEFDFPITYVIGGEEKTFSAVYICEFDGTSWSLEGGDYTRDWNAYVEGDYGGDDYSAIVATTEDSGNIVLSFGLYPIYFMGDGVWDGGAPVPSIYVSYPANETGESRSVNDPAEVEELYGAKIISYEYDEPNVNTFGLFK